MKIENVFKNNEDWIQKKLSIDNKYFEKLSQGQAPEFLYIGCSDSRVPPSEMTNTDPGQMFVHRNIANLVVHTDMNFLSVLQYAVNNLGSTCDRVWAL